MKNDEINSIVIYPPIGISRIGNSQEYFLSSDISGVSTEPTGGFKDSEGRVKKQVARLGYMHFNL
ncbi:LodA/GoxA family CTQ-dependent oxidase [Aquimarina sp. I32.4]|uniref:LodA/GoxA family CTQ-dependent oxidase n=1 Tax=Aquimarina sp. I32.4 TaxID=2053903 RepID=UPI000CDEB811|nr:LodA/GoxA family CTQ-dependent oxidase [Aquimarina sp. I32.4]